MATESELLRAYNDSAAKAGAGAAQNAQPTQTTQNTPAMQSAAQYPQGTQGTQTAETPTQTPQAPAADAAGGAADAAGNGGYNNNVVNGAYNTARMDAINQMYDAQRAAREAELKNASGSAYTTSIAFKPNGFDLTFVSGGNTYTNEFTVTEDSSGNITKIENTTAGKEITVTYD